MTTHSPLIDVNLDAIVGPTHHFGGIGVGNLASQSHRGVLAMPKSAAIQGLAKMRRCVGLGAKQIVIPPPHRPVAGMLRRLGYTGTLPQMLRAAKDEPTILSAVWSASSMWTANAATVSAAASSHDGRMHLTIANLSSSLHRSLEPPQTWRMLKTVFSDPSFVVHRPLPGSVPMRDEGAANHMRLCDATGNRGIDIFVYGSDDARESAATRLYPRQSLRAAQAVARLHELDPANTFFLKQHPEAIDAGAFHNDVVAASHRHLWMHHDRAYANASSTLDAIEKRFAEVTGRQLQRIVIAEADVSLAEAVTTYLFNSQLFATSGEDMTILCPGHVAQSTAATACLDKIIAAGGPITRYESIDLRQSMNNGGGPACLRLRVPMTAQQWQSIPPTVRFDDTLAEGLTRVIERYYPDTLSLDDLATADWVTTSRAAVDMIQKYLNVCSRERRRSTHNDL